MTTQPAGKVSGLPAGHDRAGHDVVLRAEHISVQYAGRRPTRAVRDVTIELHRGEVLGIAGESGCGKYGSITFYPADGPPADVLALDAENLRMFRWNKISMVFQSAMNALNPVTSVAKQFDDIFAAHRPQLDRGARRMRAMELLDMVGIDPGRIRSFPHELSGGMRQRVMIAMALSLSPEIVIMDEPTTALDVVVQREILDEIERLREELGFSVIFITHDLSLLLEISDRLAVMYAGEIVEYAPADLVGVAPAHPYTEGLLRSFPDMRSARRELRGVPGTPPDLRDDFPGCPFQPRCEHRFEPCRTIHPVLRPAAGRAAAGRAGRGQPPAASGWRVACHLHDPDHRPQGPPAGLDGTAESGGAAGSGGTSGSGGAAAAGSPVTVDSAVTADSAGGEL